MSEIESAEPRDGRVARELETVRDRLTGMAEKFVNGQKGEFYPFASVINATGKEELFGATIGDGRPNPKELYVLLCSGLGAGAREGQFRAAGICTNVNVTIGERVHASGADTGRARGGRGI